MTRNPEGCNLTVKGANWWSKKAFLVENDTAGKYTALWLVQEACFPFIMLNYLLKKLYFLSFISSSFFFFFLSIHIFHFLLFLYGNCNLFSFLPNLYAVVLSSTGWRNLSSFPLSGLSSSTTTTTTKEKKVTEEWACCVCMCVCVCVCVCVFASTSVFFIIKWVKWSTEKHSATISFTWLQIKS